MTSTFLIAEIGQNHNGSVKHALELIKAAAKPLYDPETNNVYKGFDAVKLVIRDLDAEMSPEMEQMEYNNPNSFGRTYMEHREALEFEPQTLNFLLRTIKEHGLQTVVTFCNPAATGKVDLDLVDHLKLASRDINNIPLIKCYRNLEKPVIFSNGFYEKNSLDMALESFPEAHILHCVSKYPTDPEEANMPVIKELQKKYGDRIGYSDHTIGSQAAVLSVALGAKIIEKHITLDRGMRGSDHICSLPVSDFPSFLLDVRRAEKMMRPNQIDIFTTKLGRSLAYAYDATCGTKLALDHFHMISPGSGLSWSSVRDIIGKKLKKDVKRNALVSTEDVE